MDKIDREIKELQEALQAKYNALQALLEALNKQPQPETEPR